ncbi:hypothetical protein [Vitreimonas sp.]|uniref:hypothetical protein n=1 Tax=Vitreimonas sp. TaxID=3069702 RepID=UPI002EDBA48E
MRLKFVAALVAASMLASAPALATTSERDLQVMARAVGFVEGLPRGNVTVAVVDGPGADAIVAAMGAGVAGGGVTLVPRKVAVGALAGSGARVIIVPEGQGGSHAAIAAAARGLHAVTLSTDMACVNSGNCVVGVAAEPRVEIVVSRAASSANGISFAQAFRVMIREI